MLWQTTVSSCILQTLPSCADPRIDFFPPSQETWAVLPGNCVGLVVAGLLWLHMRRFQKRLSAETLAVAFDVPDLQESYVTRLRRPFLSEPEAAQLDIGGVLELGQASRDFETWYFQIKICQLVAGLRGLDFKPSPRSGCG